MNLREKMHKKLSQKYPGQNIVNDGILVDEVFEQTPAKVLFLLKETYGGYLNIEGPQLIKNGKSVPFWPNIYNWTKLSHDHITDVKPKCLSKDQITKINKYVDNIAYINIKKIEGKSISDDSEILYYAKKDRDILQYQINEIRPDIIFTSNLEYYQTIYDIKSLQDLHHKSIKSGKLCFESIYHSNRLILKIHHPSHLKKQKETFDSLVKLLKINKQVI